MSGQNVRTRFMLSKTLSLLGNSIASIVFPLILLATTGDALAAGTLALICAVPQVLAGIAGGAVLDRFNRKKISILSDMISAISVALLPLIDLTIGLNFGWFALLGVLGAIGDVPGMTARDTLLPAVVKHDDADLQSFMGASQAIDSLVVIVGPAMASLLIAFLGGTSALWITASLSLLAALVTATLPSCIGKITETSTADSAAKKPSAPAKTMLRSFQEGTAILFEEGTVRTAVMLSLGTVMVLGSYQGLILPVHFTMLQQPEFLGYTLSALSFGMLAGSLAYAALARRLRKETWYALSLIGMACGIIVLGLLPSYVFLLLGAIVLGAFSGPISALLGFLVIDRVPEEKRGTVLGTQNSLMLVAAPLAIFCSSVLVSSVGTNAASLALVGLWLLITAWALRRRQRSFVEEVQTGNTAL